MNYIAYDSDMSLECMRFVRGFNPTLQSHGNSLMLTDINCSIMMSR